MIAGVKIVNISPKRQITIPQRFFKMYGFTMEAKITAKETGILIEPAEKMNNNELAVECLKELVNKGLNGQELIEAFKKHQEG